MTAVSRKMALFIFFPASTPTLGVSAHGAGFFRRNLAVAKQFIPETHVILYLK